MTEHTNREELRKKIDHIIAEEDPFQAVDAIMSLIDDYEDGRNPKIITVYKDGSYIFTENHPTAIEEDANFENYLVTIDLSSKEDGDKNE